MATRKKNAELTTPKGIFAFPALHAPDYGKEPYLKPNGVYKVSLVMDKDAPATQAFLEALEPHYKEAIAEAEEAFKQLPVASRKKHGKITVNDLYVERYDKETEEPTGEIEFRCAMDASGEFKTGPKKGERWTRKPLVFDAKGNRIKDVPEVWGGTEGKLRVQLRPYFVTGTATAGLKLGLLAAQIIHLVEGGERSAEGFGFGEEEGFVNKADEPFENHEPEEDIDNEDF